MRGKIKGAITLGEGDGYVIAIDSKQGEICFSITVEVTCLEACG